MVLRRSIRWVSAAISLSLALSCSTKRDPNDLFAPGGVGIPVVDAVLEVGKLFPPVYLTRTLAPDEPYSYEAASIHGAAVSIETDNARFEYGEDVKGRYLLLNIIGSLDCSGLVCPSTTYRLTAVLPDGTTLRATTTTPAAVDVREWVLLDSSGQTVEQVLETFNDSLSTDEVFARNQLIYTQGLVEIRPGATPVVGWEIGLSSLDTGSRLLPNVDFLNESDLKNFTRVSNSPPFYADGKPLRVPWFAVYYEGRYIMRLYSMDRNWYDLARTDPAIGSGGFGFGGETGDTSTRPIFHVEGGIGLFGSMAADSIGFYVNPLPGS
jgi:TusA-related sulfurtransferase